MSDASINTPAAHAMSRRMAITAGLFGGANLLSAPAVKAASDPAGMCRITPQVTQGPYWIDPKLARSDITEGRPGVPLHLAITVLDAATCRPFEQARVDVWHCDAAGSYSGFDQPGGSTVGQTFLRGHVFTGPDGVARMQTIYPGWYKGRTPHIHVKVFLDDGGAENLLTCQLFFPDALSEQIYAHHPDYKRTQQRDTLNRQDGIARQQGYANFGAVSEQADHYAMSVILGVDRTVRSTETMMGPPGGGGPPPGARLGPAPGAARRPPREGMGPHGRALTEAERIAALFPHKSS